MVRRVLVAWLLLGGVAHADPTAEEHHTRGKRLLTEKDYAAAEAEFAAAYAIDREPRYLFNLAIARRLGGKCREAIASYREFLATNPVEVWANNARSGIDLCERTLPPEPVPPRCGDGQLAGPEACDDGNLTGADGCSATCTVDDGWSCAGQPSTCSKIAMPVPAVVVETREPWYRDRAGNALTISGSLATISGVVLYVFARREASASFDAGPLDEFERHRDRASLFQTTAWITGGAGLALIAGGVIRYARGPRRTVREQRPITITPSRSGLALGGTW